MAVRSIRSWVGFAGVLVLALPSLSPAQDFQISGFAGWRLGGSGRDPISAQEIDIGGARSVGGAAGVRLSERYGLELYFSRAESEAEPIFTAESLELELSYLQLGFVHELGSSSAIRPFLALALGGARVRHGTGESRTRLSLGAGIGTRLFPIRHVGVRAEARLLFVLDDDGTSRSRSIGPGGGSGFGIRGGTLLQGDLTIGLVLAF
jgi:hypothetical protein